MTKTTYNYDANGNRLARIRGGTADVTYTYDNQDRLLTATYSAGIVSYEYNHNGDRTKKTDGRTSPAAITKYYYDILGNLTRVDLPPEPGFPSGTTIFYFYNGVGQRVGKGYGGLGITKRWMYYPDGKLAAEYRLSQDTFERTRLTWTFVYGPNGGAPQYAYSMETGGAAGHDKVLSDHLGSVVGFAPMYTSIVDAGGYRKYDEFGVILADPNPNLQPLGFAGGVYDPETALVHLGARDYDAEVGRWLQKDPIGFAGGDTNFYGYVMNDPVNFVDPSGLLYLSVQVGGSFWGSKTPSTTTGKSASIGSGVGFDTKTMKFFTFHSQGKGTKAVGLFAGVGLSFGIDWGDSFFGRSTTTTTSAAWGWEGGGWGSSATGLSLDLFGPGLGVGTTEQEVLTCPGLSH